MPRSCTAKSLRPLFAAALIAAFGGCGRQSNQPEAWHTLHLHLRYGQAPGTPAFVAPGSLRRAELSKTARLVEDQVLLLHCDDATVSLAQDASDYHNDFSLYNIKRDSSATAALKEALILDGTSGYGLSNGYGSEAAELDATQGFELSVRLRMTGPVLSREQRIFDRHDPLGGFTVGTIIPAGTAGYTPRPYVRFKQDGIETTLVGRTSLAFDRWYKVTARYDLSKLTLLIDDKSDTSRNASGAITASSRATVLGAGWNGDVIGYYFNGRLDEISLTTRVEYEDLDMVRLAVFDFSDFASEEAFYRSETWQQYHAALENMTADSTFVPTWDKYIRLWEKYFKVVSEQNLSVNGAFATGTVRGVEGMNALVISGIRNGVMTYYGEALVLATGEGATEVWVPFYGYGGGID
ncbi:MAG TPA: hypothetical protein PKI62_13155 [bacterium]|nr:hypothetical protein [bacterium]HPR89103.1 hypothetical protein [bacterium]